VRHEPGHDDVGSPLCEDCFEWEDAVLWNALASRLWNRTIDKARRQLAFLRGLTLAELRRQASVQYLRVAEIQRRGSVHFHAVVRADGPERASRPPPWLTTALLERSIRRAVATTRVQIEDWMVAFWGRQLDVVDLGTTQGDAARVAGYVAKYATKTTDGDFGLARRFRDHHDLEHARTQRHFRLLAECAWELGGHPGLEGLRLCEHAHTLGFTGQLITKSRGFSTTFGALRAIRAAFIAEECEPAPDDAVYMFAGRGYSDPRAETLTELLIELDADARKERRLRRLEVAEGGNSGRR
jgi:hypothetical protein